MDASLKAKWVEALRSGEFTQARNGIGNASRKNLCCLGVGAVAMRPSFDPDTTGDAIDELVKHGFDGYSDDKFSPTARRLIKMNDEEGAGFPEIADYIEANL